MSSSPACGRLRGNSLVWLNSCSGIEIIGLGMYDGKDWYIPDEFRYRAITDIAIDHDNTKWISSGVLLKMPDTRDVSVSENKGFPGADIRLSNNIPNPFNPSTTIQYSLPAPADVKLIVYSVSGQKIVTLVDACMPAGTHSAVFDGSNAASGLYFFRLEAGNTVRSGKMMLIR